MKTLARLLKKEISLSYLLYRVFRANRLSRKIINILYNIFVRGKKNKLSSGIEMIQIQTYDGFDQCTHPDVSWYLDRLFLIVTPYPFSDERYENPSIYVMNCDDSFSPVAKNPLIDFEKRSVRHHYSDPALLTKRNELFVFYRDSIHDENGRIDEIYRGSFQDGFLINTVKIHFGINHCISPSFTYVNGQVFVFFVSDDASETILYQGEYNNESVKKIRKTIIHGFAYNMKIWHVDVKYRNNQYEGLFTFMKEPGFGDTRLFLAKSNDGIDWYLLDEITFGDRTNVKNLYKATSFVEAGGVNAFISALDSHGRWFLYKKKGIQWR